MRYRFLTADVFTERTFGGNPLAVIPDARGLDTERMQQIAREFNYSETTFVYPPDDSRHTRRVRIFPPAVELAFAGHPTVGTAFVLATIGEIPLAGEDTRLVLEEGVGPVPVSIRSETGRPGFVELTAAMLPESSPFTAAAHDLAALLSLGENDLAVGGPAPEIASCGTPFLFVPVRSSDAVRRARIDRARWQALRGAAPPAGIDVFCLSPDAPGTDVHARVFLPDAGIEEDPATGSAAAAMVGILASFGATSNGTRRWVIDQGAEMGRPSRIEATAEIRDGRIFAVRVGGHSVLVCDGAIEVPL